VLDGQSFLIIFNIKYLLTSLKKRTMKTVPQIDGEKIINFLGLAHDDYLASRLLLLNGMLPQGCALAATSIEKYLKAILSVHNEKIPKKSHLSNNLTFLIKKIYPELYDELYRDDFAKFLGIAYDILRYAPIQNNGFSIVLNQYRTLERLDNVVANLEKGFNIQKDNKIIETPLHRDVKNNSLMLIKDNVVFGNISKEELFAKENLVHELKVGKNLSTLQIKYTTRVVFDTGSFCKKPELTRDKPSFTLTKG